ncbi:NAD(P)H-dependent glycerol-3-phosphate dehydrogenase [Aeromonas hydrophila]|uniref:NAD(P)H-dependent glycerol-3-phosphate dehydrogenase n=1 Tax=Aeromonas hydrophila TaxID=644 RepID=UPI003F79A415
MKNVIAIGAGLSDGLGFGANARTALITRGLVEMQRLGAARCRCQNLYGDGGARDMLVLTCTDNQSRNRRFGLALGAGKDVNTAMTESAIGQVVEGYRNTKEVHLLAARCGVEMPICEQFIHLQGALRRVRTRKRRPSPCCRETRRTSNLQDCPCKRPAPDGGAFEVFAARAANQYRSGRRAGARSRLLHR